MIITLQQLKEAGACPLALQAFEKAVGQQTADMEWNQAAQGLMLADPLWRRWFGEAFYLGIIPMFSMKNIHLRGINLCGADLGYVCLIGANLIGANLCKANLREVNLRKTNLIMANLHRTSLYKT